MANKPNSNFNFIFKIKKIIFFLSKKKKKLLKN